MMKKVLEKGLVLMVIDGDKRRSKRGVFRAFSRCYFGPKTAHSRAPPKWGHLLLISSIGLTIAGKMIEKGSKMHFRAFWG